MSARTILFGVALLGAVGLTFLNWLQPGNVVMLMSVAALCK